MYIVHGKLVDEVVMTTLQVNNSSGQFGFDGGEDFGRWQSSLWPATEATQGNHIVVFDVL